MIHFTATLAGRRKCWLKNIDRYIEDLNRGSLNEVTLCLKLETAHEKPLAPRLQLHAYALDDFLTRSTSPRSFTTYRFRGTSCIHFNTRLVRLVQKLSYENEYLYDDALVHPSNTRFCLSASGYILKQMQNST